MIYLLLALAGIANLCVGYVAALKFRELSLGELDLALDDAPLALEETDDDESEHEAAEINVAPTQLVSVPNEWVELLGEIGESSTFVEAAIEVFKLEIDKYRERLLAIDMKLHDHDSPDAEFLSQTIIELTAAGNDYLKNQADACRHLTDGKASLGELTAVGEGLESTLLEEAAQIETTLNNLDDLNPDEDPATVIKPVAKEVARLLDRCHNLRDCLHESFAEVLRTEDRFINVDQSLLADKATGIFNRAGAESIFSQWQDEDPSLSRLFSIGLLDVAGTRAVNVRQGFIIGDQMIVAVGQLLNDALRKSRGFDVAARFDGQRFLFIFGDTGPRQATSAVERFRQTCEAAVFKFEGEELQINLTACVTDFRPGDTTTTLFQRAMDGVVSAKQAGHNCTFLDEGQGMAQVEPPTYKVKSRVIQIARP